MSSFFKQVQSLLSKEFTVWSHTKSALLRELLIPLFVAFIIFEFLGEGNSIFFIAIYLPLSLAGFVRGFAFEIAFEKSEKFKEYLRINGVQVSTYYTSWIIFGFMRVFLTSIIIMLGVAFAKNNPFDASQFFQFWFTYLLFGLATISFCLALSCLFSNPKLATDITGLLFSLSSFLFLGIIQQKSQSLYIVAGLLPQLTISYALVSQTTASSDMFTGIPDLSTSTIIQSCNVILYFSLFLFADNFIPDEYGIKRKLCRRRNKKVDSSESLKQRLVDPNAQNGRILSDEDTSSAKHHQKMEGVAGMKRALSITDLKKKFGNSQVIKGVSFTIYEGQIYCLLGHNGAGKTTTINILTGILEADGGSIMYGDLSFSTDFIEVRKTLGFCAQKDILYDDLTVDQHLRMIGIIRGIDSSVIEMEIKRVAEKVGLGKDRMKLARTLSGGNKRKLCLGMAIIGNVKVIFLDEPTSGLDANSRRSVWEVLRALKNDGITIILTTHHLDEADELADRIAIMSKGTLHSVGTSQFLKREFGEGYQLLITPKYHGEQTDLELFERQKVELANIVRTTVTTSQLNDKTPPEIMKFSLPFAEADKFAPLFEVLEGYKNIQLSLEMNTLEDAFINIGLEEQHEEEQLSASQINNLTEVEVPKSITKNPEYRFMDQFKALVKRKFLCYIRSFMNVFMTALPVFLNFVVLLTNNVSTAEPEIQAWGVAQTFNLAFSLNAGVYAGFPVAEREFKLKYALKVMGCRTSAYWLGTLAFDIALISLMMLIFVVLSFIGQLTILTENIGYFIPGVLGFGCSLVTSAYMWGFIYEKSQSAYKSYSIFALGVMYYLPFWMGYLFQTKNIPQLEFVFRLIGYSIGPFTLIQDQIFAFSGKNLINTDILSDNFALYPLLLFTQAIVYMIITLLLESRKYNINVQSIKKPLIPYKENPIFDANEINGEAKRIADPSNIDPIRTYNLSKVYDNGFQAVRGISFGVEKKQIFGLLGPNGAGKSTTFSLLTALVPRTAGSVQLAKSEIDNNMYDIFKEVGVCPQFDCLWEDLTVYEHLEVFGSMKGLSGAELKENVDFYIKTMQLSDHINKKSKILSGGNKRKLCVTNALIGSPSLQFFDEPSTGLDPVARRYLYDTMTNNLAYRDASIILTTHSLTEAEMLCHKIGIVINGKFVCIGTTSYLKNKYGSGYRVIVPAPNTPGGEETLENEMRQFFPNLQKLETGSRETITYQIPIEGFKFSKAFKSLMDMKEKKIISEYSLMNTTLEQIFLSFSKFQEIKD